MKAIIEGKLYDVETAEELGSASYGSSGDFERREEWLYRAPGGAYFTAGSGGPKSRYARNTGQNETSGGSAIRPLTEAEARAWMERHGNVAEYIAAFGEPEGA